MAINKSMRRVLKALSFDGIEVEASRHLANLKAIDPMKIFHKTIDYKIYNGNHQIPVRIFLPGEKMEDDLPVFLFFHGGGWVTESIDNYERICARLASATDHIVVSVEYRLAPEYPFPIGFYDCYMAAKAMYTNQFILNTDPDKITLIGDSAGGKGFYTTTNFEQAKKWALLKKNREQSEKAIVSVYEVPDDILDREYPVLRFMGATKEWLEFVVNNRRGRENGDYDLIMGPAANDQLYATIRLYEQRVVTAEAAIEMLKAHKLFNQLSFHTVTVALLLKFVESIEVG